MRTSGLRGDSGMTPQAPKLTAFRIPGHSVYPDIVPAPADREWIDQNLKGWANRCLPLRIANQAGWIIRNPAAVEVVWDGKPYLTSVKIAGGSGDPIASSMFGYGIITFSFPYLFRTPPGFNLIARGPANLPRDGVSPLEGIVETDWLSFPFTMNWQITRKLKVIRFEAGEPLCMIAPQRRGELEDWTPEIRNLESDPVLQQNYEKYLGIRMQAAKEARERTIHSPSPGLQGFYHRAAGPSGEQPNQQAHAHQVRIAVPPFVSIEPPLTVPQAPGEASLSQPKGFLARLLHRKR